MGRLTEFLENYNNQSTRGGYRSGVLAFIKFIYGITDVDKDRLEELVDQYFDDKRDHKTDLMKFAVGLQKRPPLSARQVFNQVNEFLSMNDVVITPKDIKRARNKLPKGGVATQEKDMDLETIRSILAHSDVKGEALWLTAASSGGRIGEILTVTLKDIDFDSRPVKINIRGKNTKTGYQRFTFISTEAAQSVREWLKVRAKYLDASLEKGMHLNGRTTPKSSEDDRLFPFSDNIANQMFEQAVKSAGLFERDETTNRMTLHIHMFRKFFLSQLSLKAPKEIAEALAGHAGYLTGAYRRYTTAQLAEQYLNAEYLVTIQVPTEIKEIQNEFREKMQNQTEIVEKLVTKNMRLEDEITRIQQEMARQKEIESNLENHPLFAEIKKALPEMIEAELKRKMES
jgi:integrase